MPFKASVHSYSGAGPFFLHLRVLQLNAGCPSFRGINVSALQSIKSSHDILLIFEYKYLDIHISATFDNYNSPLMCGQVKSRLIRGWVTFQASSSFRGSHRKSRLNNQ